MSRPNLQGSTLDRLNEVEAVALTWPEQISRRRAALELQLMTLKQHRQLAQDKASYWENQALTADHEITKLQVELCALEESEG